MLSRSRSGVSPSPSMLGSGVGSIVFPVDCVPFCGLGNGGVGSLSGHVKASSFQRQIPTGLVVREQGASCVAHVGLWPPSSLPMSIRIPPQVLRSAEHRP